MTRPQAGVAVRLLITDAVAAHLGDGCIPHTLSTMLLQQASGNLHHSPRLVSTTHQLTSAARPLLPLSPTSSSYACCMVHFLLTLYAPWYSPTCQTTGKATKFKSACKSPCWVTCNCQSPKQLLAHLLPQNVHLFVPSHLLIQCRI